jgi:hypothetical protein
VLNRHSECAQSLCQTAWTSIYHVTSNLGQKETTSKWPDVVMTVRNGVYVIEHKVLIIKNQQDKQLTYDVTLRRVGANIVAVEKQKYYIF